MAGYIGVVPTPQATQTRDRFEATAGQTSFPTSGYTPGFLDVYANGLKINSEAYTATNGSDVVFDTAREAGDVIEVVAYSTFEAGKVTPDAVSDKDNESTGYFALPSGTSAQRPVSAVAGYTRYNSEVGSVEFYDGSNWISTNLIPTVNSVTGTIYAGAASTLTLNITNFTDIIIVRFSEGGATIADVANVSVTSGSASVAVPAAVYGQDAGDTISVSILNQDGTPSSNTISKTAQQVPTGGTITTSGSYRVHTFTSSSSFVVPSGLTLTDVSYVVVGGGGGGGSTNSGVGGAGGGGGAGGYRSSFGNSGGGSSAESKLTLTAGSYAATVGAGGNGDANGSSSVFHSITSLGGGKGGSYAGQGPASSGGSGGGAETGAGGTQGTSSAQYGSGTSGQGYRGGDSYWNATSYTIVRAGGGGGASGVGVTAGSGTLGNGGPGITSIVTGSSVEYARGGGGGSDNGTATPNGSFNQTGIPGTANRGNGGGGTATDQSVTYAGGNGGSGIVVVRYELP